MSFFGFRRQQRKCRIGNLEKISAARTIKFNRAENHFAKIGMTGVAAVRTMKRQRTNRQFGDRIDRVFRRQIGRCAGELDNFSVVGHLTISTFDDI